MLILLLGSGTFAVYQVMAMEDQLDEITRAVDKMDVKVKQAQHEKAKFYAMAKDVLRLAPKDTNAEQLVVYFKLRELQTAQPVLLDTTSLPDSSTPSDAPSVTPSPTAK